MFRKLNLTAMAVTALAAGSVITAAGPAFAENPARLKAMSFTTQNIYNQVIHVGSSDNKKWDTIKPGSVKFGAHVMIDTKGYGDVKIVGIVLGGCEGASCLGKPLLWAATAGAREYETQTTVTLPTNKIPVSSGGGIATLPFGDEILSRCNQHLSANGPTKEYGFNYWMQATFIADTHLTGWSGSNNTGALGPTLSTWGSDVDHARTATFMVKVKCDAVELETAEDVHDDENFKVKGVKLFLSTFSHATSKPNPGTVCKKGRTLVRVATTKAGPVKFRLWTKIGNGPSQSQFVQAWSSKKSDTEFHAEFTKWVSVSKTTKVQAMVEDLTNPIGQSSGWKDITLHCTGAGGGGLADVPNPNDPDNGAGVAPLKVSGELTLADSAANSNKPRLGQAVFKIWTNKPGSTSYKLTCTGGRKWEGTLPTFKVGNYKYQAVGAQNFQISKTEQIGCAVRSTSKSNDPVIALASKLFKLVKRNPNVSGPGGITTKPNPQSSGKPNKRPALIVMPKPKRAKIKVAPKPKRPLIKVAPKPKRPLIKVAPVKKVTCIGGKIANNSCFCPARTKKVKIGKTAYRCIINVMKQKKVTPARRKSFIGKKRKFSARMR